MTPLTHHRSDAASLPLVPLCVTQSRRLGRGGVGLLLLLCAGAFVLRWVYFFQTAEVPFLRYRVGDAAGYWAWGSRIAGGDWLGNEAFYQAPLYPYLLGAWFALWGECPWVVRGMQSLLTTIGVGLLGWGATRLLGRAAGLLSAALYALYAPSLFFDGIVQKESVAAALVCALLAAIAGVSHRGTFWRACVIGVLLGLLSLIRENTQLWIPVVLVWLWRQTTRDAEVAASQPHSPPSDGIGGGKMSEPGTIAARGVSSAQEHASRASGANRRGAREAGAQSAKVLALSRCLALLIGCGLALAPVAVRNRVVGGTWALSTVQSGPNFYIGNSAGADGRYRPLVRGHETPAFEREDATRLAEQAAGRPLTAREVSRYWWRRGWSDVVADPVRWAGLMMRKIAMVLNDYEVTDAESLYVYAEYSALLRGLLRVWDFGVLFPLAAAGAWATRHRRRPLSIFYMLATVYALSVAFFFVLARYRFPLVPLLAPFAAAGVVHILQCVRARRWSPLAAACGVAALAAVVAHWPVHDRARLNALAQMNLGVALAEAGELSEATAHFQRAVERHPTSAEANVNLAQALALLGRFEEAIPHYERALASDPDLFGVEYNLGVALERAGQVERALELYRRAVQRDAGDADARAAVVRLESAAK